MQQATIIMQPMDWAPLQDIDDIEPIGDADTACIHELYEVLKRHDKQDRFGLVMLHKHFEMQDDEILLERTETAQRRLVLEPAKISAPEAARSVQTSWRLSEAGGEMMRVCQRQCFRNIQGGHSDSGHRWV